MSGEQHETHGKSVAAWTAVGIMLVAFALMCWAVWVVSTPLFIVGVVLLVVGGIAGKALAMAGFGEQKHDARSAR